MRCKCGGSIPPQFAVKHIADHVVPPQEAAAAGIEIRRDATIIERGVYGHLFVQ